jgi:NADH-quinone oxidoreductase subunit D
MDAESPKTTSRRVVFGIDDPSTQVDDLPTEVMPLNMGPSHPSMHGTVRMVLEVEGEKIRSVDVQIGYMHRCFEKESEYATWTQIFPYTDRLNYVSPLLNNVGYALAVEQLLGIEKQIPERAQFIRVIIGEISRITDHLTCLAANAMEMGAFTVYFYWIKAREWLWELLEELTGARLTHSYVRIGGLASDLTEDFCPRLRDLLPRVRKAIADGEAMLLNSRIFRDRMDGIAIISREDAIAWALTGPVGRSTGLAYDVRKDHPYLVYDRFDFDVPVGANGDNFDRFAVRLEEMQQSMRILEQAMDKLPGGPVVIDNRRVIIPSKRETYNTIEGMIDHFKLHMDGIPVPAGEVYSFTEGGNGELGFYIVADGTGRPSRCHVRAPCFLTTQVLNKLLPGLFIADVVPTFGMMNYIAGECER